MYHALWQSLQRRARNLNNSDIDFVGSFCWVIGSFCLSSRYPVTRHLRYVSRP